MILCINGRFVSSSKATISPLDNGFLYGDGVYDTMRTYGGVVLELDRHLKRIEHSALLLQITLPCSRNTLRSWVLEVVRRNRLKEARVRITISRGVHGLDFTASKHSTLVVTGEPLTFDPRTYQKGVTAVTRRMERMLPEIKTLGLTNMIVSYQHDTDAYETICMDSQNQACREIMRDKSMF